jgi:Tol biopolymer transport system component
MINYPLPRSAWTVLACAALAACGGGTLDAGDADAVAADTENRATAAATTASPGVVRLASANAAGTPGDNGGQVCAISADGQQVLMDSASNNLVPGDTNFQRDLFLKNLATGAVSRVNTSAAGVPIVNRLTCHGMSQDGTWVVFTADSGGSGQIYVPGPEIEPTLMLKNTRTGELVRVSPPRSSLPNVSGFTFGSITPDGSRVAFIAQPTTTYAGPYSFEALGPARLLVYDRPQRQVLDLSATALLDAGPGLFYQANNRAVISPDGSEVAFDSRRDQPAAGDTNGQPDLLLVGVATGAVRLAGLTSPGQQSYAVPQRFTADGQRLVVELPNDGPVGVRGVYAFTLATGGAQLLMPTGSGNPPRSYSVDDTASRVAFLRNDPATAQRRYAFVRDTATGSEQRADRSATNVNGNGNTTTFAISGNGQHVALGSSSTNLLTLPRRTFPWQVYVKTLLGTTAAQ